MCVATGTAIAIAATAASAAATTYAAKKGADASKNAVKAQTDATTEARTLQEQRYQQARQDFNPYQQAGGASLARLGGLASAPRQQFNGSQSGGGFQMPQQPPPQAPQQQPTMQQAQIGAAGAMQPQGSQMAPGGIPAPVRKVTLRAPDGTTQQFPEQAVSQVIAAARAKGHELQVVG